MTEMTYDVSLTTIENGKEVDHEILKFDTKKEYLFHCEGYWRGSRMLSWELLKDTPKNELKDVWGYIWEDLFDEDICLDSEW